MSREGDSMSSTFGLALTPGFAFVVGLAVLLGGPRGGFELGADIGRDHVRFTSTTASGADDPVLEIDLPGMATGSVHVIGRAPYLSGTVYLLGLPVSLHGVPGRDLSWWVESRPAGSAAAPLR